MVIIIVIITTYVKSSCLTVNSLSLANSPLAAVCLINVLLLMLWCIVVLRYFLKNKSQKYKDCLLFAPVMLCKRGLCCHAVCVCVSVTFVHSVKTNKYIFTIFLRSDRHTILVFPHQMAWKYSDGNPPNEGIEYRWGRQKLRFWANIGLHCVLWSVPVATAIHFAATSHAKFITLVAGKRPSLLMAGNNDEEYGKKPQR